MKKLLFISFIFLIAWNFFKPPGGGFSRIDQTATGEYVSAKIRQSDSSLWAWSNNSSLTGTHSTSSDGVGGRVRTDTANLRFLAVYGALHGCYALSASHHVYYFGDDGDGQDGNGTGIGNDSAMRVKTDSAGNDFGHVVYVAAFFIENAHNGALAIKDDGSLWIWGYTQDGARAGGAVGTTLSKPVQIIIPGGRSAAQIIAGYELMVLCTDGTAWTWGPASSFASLGYAGSGNQYKSLHQIASGVMLIAGGQDFNWILDSTGTHLRRYGNWGEYMGNQDGNAITTPSDATDSVFKYLEGGLGVIADIKCNFDVTFFRMASGKAFCMGDNHAGNCGNGQQINWATYMSGGSPNPYAWDFGRGQFMVYHPIQFTNKTNWVDITGGGTFVLYTVLTDDNDSTFGIGRNKGSVMPGDSARGPTGDIIGQYADSWNDTIPKPLHPWAFGSPLIEPSPWCQSHTGATFCSEFSLPTYTTPTVSAGGPYTVAAGSSITIDAVASTNITGYDFGTPGGGFYDIRGSQFVVFTGVTPGVYTDSVRVYNNGFLHHTATFSVTVTSGIPTPPPDTLIYNRTFQIIWQ